MVAQLSTRSLEQVGSKRVRRLQEYWQSRREPGWQFPQRRNIDPNDLRDLLPLITIVDVEHTPLKFRYRLVGTQVAEYNHQEFTGQYLGEIGWEEEELLLGVYVETVTRRQPIYGQYSWELRSGGLGRSEFGLFPLTENGETIHQIIAIEEYDFHSRDVDPNRI